jgi:hypothetical protein
MGQAVSDESTDRHYLHGPDGLAERGCGLIQAEDECQQDKDDA